MTETVTPAAGRAPGAVVGSTRALLTCGIVAGPLYIVMVVLQMLTRDGFDISRHPASMLSNGDQGWIQIATFAVSGLLFVAYAIGIYRMPDPARPGLDVATGRAPADPTRGGVGAGRGRAAGGDGRGTGRYVPETPLSLLTWTVR